MTTNSCIKMFIQRISNRLPCLLSAAQLCRTYAPLVYAKLHLLAFRLYAIFTYARFPILILGICSGPVFAGYTIGYSSSASVDFISARLLLESEVSMFASLVNLGGMIGSLLVGSLLDRFGRRWTLFVSAIPSLLGWLIIWRAGSLSSTSSYLVSFVYTGRVLTGISCGMSMAATAVYLVEIAPTAWRGTIGSCNQLGIVTGIALVYYLGRTTVWFLLARIGMVAPIVLLLTTLWAPESPRWLLQRSRRADAAVALRRLRPVNTDVEEELVEMASSCSDSSVVNGGYTELLKPAFRSQLYLAIGLVVAQQFSGINAIMFYAESIFVTAGLHSGAAGGAVVVGLVQLVFTAVGVFLTGRYQRTYLLKLAGLLMALTHLLFAIYYSLELRAGYMAVAFLALYILGFSIAWGPLPMLIIAEIFPLRARSAAGGASVFVLWVCSFLVTRYFSYLQEVLGQGGVFYAFSVACFLAVFFVHHFVPETKGRSLDELETACGGGGVKVPV